MIGAWLQGLFETGIDMAVGALNVFLTGVGVNATIHSLLIDGICNGVGSVLSFGGYRLFGPGGLCDG